MQSCIQGGTPIVTSLSHCTDDVSHDTDIVILLGASLMLLAIPQPWALSLGGLF
ncbi:MAG: hypothetical protein JXB07_07510 [Anaerolineae bacterium]|nr:hypothetical protein [Anaerolineae bacterium]